MLRQILGAALAVGAIVWIALVLCGCDVMEQDVEVYVPGNPPGEGDEEDKAQTLFEE